MKETNMLKNQQVRSVGSATPYIIGFLLSIILTFAAYIPVVIHSGSHHSMFSHELLIPLVLFFAIVQLVVQLLFFLHLGQEKKPHWNLIFFVSTVSIILLVVVGSLWIMYHLNYNMMPSQIDQHVMQDEGIQLPKSPDQHP